MVAENLLYAHFYNLTQSQIETSVTEGFARFDPSLSIGDLVIFFNESDPGLTFRTGYIYFRDKRMVRLLTGNEEARPVFANVKYDEDQIVESKGVIFKNAKPRVFPLTVRSFEEPHPNLHSVQWSPEYVGEVWPKICQICKIAPVSEKTGAWLESHHNHVVDEASHYPYKFLQNDVLHLVFENLEDANVVYHIFYRNADLCVVRGFPSNSSTSHSGFTRASSRRRKYVNKTHKQQNNYDE